MDTDTAFKLAIDDVRAGLKAQHEVILFVDKQAGDLLKLFVTLAIAAAGVALERATATQANWSVAIGLGVVVACLTIGSAYCFRAINEPAIENPARLPGFWAWVGLDTVKPHHALKAYLASVEETRSANAERNRTAARAYRGARWMGAVAAPLGVTTALACRYLLS